MGFARNEFVCRKCNYRFLLKEMEGFLCIQLGIL